MTELRECPFCGGMEMFQGLKLGGPYVIWCHRCNAEITDPHSMDDTISAWNRRADDWQPIETAPRDGTEVLVSATMPDHLQWADPDKQLRPIVRVTAWHPDAGWCVDELREASHWRPLPKGPGG